MLNAECGIKKPEFFIRVNPCASLAKALTIIEEEVCVAVR